MKWFSFFKKNNQLGRGGSGQSKNRGVRELPAEVGRYLVTILKLEPDWVWALRCVAQPQGESKRKRDVRIFSPTAVRNRRVEVKGYTSLDEHPDLILFDGWFDKINHDCRLAVRGK